MQYNQATQKKMNLAASKGMKVAALKEGESLEAAYKRLAKQADQRLVRLESYKHDKDFEGILSYSYNRAMQDIKSYSGDNANRFNTKMPTDKRTIERKINDMLRFLNSPTSTKSGVIKMYKQRTETINKKYGTNFTWQELGRFFASDKLTALESESKVSSDLILKAIGKQQQNKDEIEKQIQDENGRHVQVSDEDINEQIYKNLSESGITLDMLRDKPVTRKTNKKKTRKK